VKKVDKGRTPDSKTLSAFKASPEKIAADRVAASVFGGAVYEEECGRLSEVFTSKIHDWNSVVAVRTAAYWRAFDEFETAFSRLTAEERIFGTVEEVYSPNRMASQSWLFAKQLESTVISAKADLDKAVMDKAVSIERYEKKYDKLWEAYSLIWDQREDVEPPSDMRL